MAASRRKLVTTSLALLSCLAFLPGATECRTAPPPPASAPAEIAPQTAPAAPAPAQPAVTPQTTPEVRRPSANARPEAEQNVIDVFRAAAPATVFVTQKRVVRDWSMRALEIPAGTGTGFVWDDQGHVVTNYHVIDAGRSRGRYSVTLYDQKTYDAELLGGDPNKDIAVLKLVDVTGPLTPIRVLPEGNTLEVGQTAIAIGNPFGLDHTLTTGVISATGREVQGYGGISIRDMIQTDASINPGNSGGPLLDSGGHLIGMNTMIYSKTGSSAGIGFAVPVSTIRRVVPQIITKGRVDHPGLGIEPLSDQYAAREGIEGVVVIRTFPGSPAAQAGIRGLSQDRAGNLVLGDIIVGIDDKPVKSFDDLYNTLDNYKVGDEVTVRVRREGRPAEVRLKLIDLP